MMPCFDPVTRISAGAAASIIAGTSTTKQLVHGAPEIDVEDSPPVLLRPEHRAAGLHARIGEHDGGNAEFGDDLRGDRRRRKGIADIERISRTPAPSALAASSRSPGRSSRATRSPASSRRRRAAARPMPEAAPVTTASLPAPNAAGRWRRNYAPLRVR